jgi:hypothetical protein
VLTVRDDKLTMQGYELASLEVAKRRGMCRKIVVASQTWVSK